MADEQVKPKEVYHDFFMIPNGFLNHLQKMSLRQIKVFIVLSKHADVETRECWPSLSTIAREAGTCKARVIDALAELETLGFIEKADNGGGRGYKNSYTLVFEPKKRVSV